MSAFGQGLGWWVGVMIVWVRIICADGRSRYLYIVLGATRQAHHIN